MIRLFQLERLRRDASLHAFGAMPGTEARRIREARRRRIVAAYWVESARVDAARLCRLAPYLKRAGKVAA